MVSENYSLKSDSSDDDNITLLREAADPDLINDRMFQLAGKKTVENVSTDSSKANRSTTKTCI